MKYDKEFKEEALRLSDEIGSRNAAEKLGIPYYTLADWRKAINRSAEYAFIGSGNKRLLPGMSIREQDLGKENRELKRANDILKDALLF
jgi:transposase